MSHALNTYVFGAPDAPLKKLTLSLQGNEIKQSGTLNKGVGVPFEMTGSMSATEDGRIWKRGIFCANLTLRLTQVFRTC